MSSSVLSTGEWKAGLQPPGLRTRFRLEWPWACSADVAPGDALRQSPRSAEGTLREPAASKTEAGKEACTLVLNRFQFLLSTRYCGHLYYFTVPTCTASNFHIVMSSAADLLSCKNFNLHTCPMTAQARTFSNSSFSQHQYICTILTFSTKQCARNLFSKYHIPRENIIYDLHSRTSHLTLRKKNTIRVTSPLRSHTPNEPQEMSFLQKCYSPHQREERCCWVSGFQTV